VKDSGVAANDRQREALTQLLEQREEIGGRFRDLKRLDQGSTGHFSALLSAADDQTRCRVALKFLLPLFSGGYRDDSFEREAALLEELQGQPDIIQLVAPRSDFTETLRTEQGLEIPISFSYYALELAHTDVGTIIANEEWDAEDLLLAFRGICRAVQRLHARTIAHRDLKPPNFLVMKDRSIRLSDLGTARRLDGLTPALATYTGPPGDVRYAAPEMLAIVHDEVPTIAFDGDFFALGAILFEMFSGTILGSRIYDSRFVADLAQAMVHVKRGQRRQIFDELIPTIADARAIPGVSTFGARVPNCLRDPIDDLIRRLASLDYRKRLRDFQSIFNRLNICLLILRNEVSYQRWLAEKRRRREAARLMAVRSIV
jgi:serine/threonine protein kinase